MSDDFDINFELKLGSKAAGAGGGVSALRRIELITGVGRRRRLSNEQKTRIVVESLADGVSVSEVARRHGLIPQQLFAWRREAQALLHEGGSVAPVDGSAANPAPRPGRGKGWPKPTREICDDAPAFAPVVISASDRSSPSRPSQLSRIGSGTIEIAIDDAVVRVIGQAETEALVAVLLAVRRTNRSPGSGFWWQHARWTSANRPMASLPLCRPRSEPMRSVARSTCSVPGG